MNKKSILKEIKKIYEKGGNIVQYLREGNNNSLEDIMISYDFQAGNYTKLYYEEPEMTKELCNCFYNYLSKLSFNSIMEAGVGEANKLVTLLGFPFSNLDFALGCDLSWSRIKTAQKFALEHKDCICTMPELFVGDMSNLPIMDKSVDLVYTMYSLEPNGGREEQLIRELERVAKKYIVMLEPSYELANQEQKKRMDEHGYVKHLPEIAKKIGLEVLVNEKFAVDENPMNPTGIIVCKVKDSEKENADVFGCPITRTSLKKMNGAYYSEESMLVYPIIGGVACLTEENAVVATKYMDFL